MSSCASQAIHHYDQVGSTILRTNGTGSVIGRAEYSAYGIRFWNQGDMATPFLYNGALGVQTDPNGLLNMRARYYSPYLMRFLNADPIGFSGGPNWFAYADGNPISKNDPFGLDAIFLWGDNKNQGDDDYFRIHAEAQAKQYSLDSRPILTVEPVATAYPVFGTRTKYGDPEPTHVFRGSNNSEWQHALNAVKNITHINYVGHSSTLGLIGLDSLDRRNTDKGATIHLNGCHTGVDDNNTGSFSAQRFADHFQAPTRGITEGLSFGIPIPGISNFRGSAYTYTDIAPEYMRGEGGITPPQTMWAQPSQPK